MLLVRRVGALVLTAAAIAVFFGVSPQSTVIAIPPDNSADIAQVESSYGSNNGSAQYIYGQIFAATAATKDAALLVARQQQTLAEEQARIARAAASQGPDRRIPAELVLLIALGALFMVTAPRPSPLDRMPGNEPIGAHGLTSFGLPGGAPQ